MKCKDLIVTRKEKFVKVNGPYLLFFYYTLMFHWHTLFLRSLPSHKINLNSTQLNHLEDFTDLFIYLFLLFRVTKSAFITVALEMRNQSWTKTFSGF